MNFCSNCGHKISFGNIPNDTIPRFHCENCQMIHYQNPNIVTGCLPIWEDKVLLCRRAIEPRKGFWNVPGGYLENGETVEEGAMREVWEEALAKVEITSLHLIYDIPQINQVYMHFLGNLIDGKFGIGEESTEVKLFDEAEIPWDDIAFSSSKQTLKLYFESRRTGNFKTHRDKLIIKKEFLK